jgi:hypothetical protein
MAGRTKGQSGVSPEVRQEWLQLFEERGLSPKAIGERYNNYTAVTVRRHLATARQERERRETRFVVLRDAMELHYKDLLQLLERAQATISEEDSIAEIMRDRRWKALVEHMPKLPLWRLIASWEGKLGEISDAMANIKAMTTTELRTSPGFAEAFAGLDMPTVSRAFEEQAKAWRNKSRGFDIARDLKITPGEEGMSNVKVRAYDLGECRADQAQAVTQVLLDFREKLHDSSEVKAIGKAEERLKALAPELDEELATAILRRVLPGHCKYCPV